MRKYWPGLALLAGCIAGFLLGRVVGLRTVEETTKAQEIKHEATTEATKSTVATKTEAVAEAAHETQGEHRHIVIRYGRGGKVTSKTIDETKASRKDTTKATDKREANETKEAIKIVEKTVVKTVEHTVKIETARAPEWIVGLQAGAHLPSLIHGESTAGGWDLHTGAVKGVVLGASVDKRVLRVPVLDVDVYVGAWANTQKTAGIEIKITK